MKAALTIVIVLAASGACGHKQPTGGGGAASGTGSAPAASVDAGPGGGSASGSAAVNETPLTRDECIAMLGHILDIAADERNKAKPDATTTDEQQKGRQRLIDEQTGPCTEGIPRSQYDCAMNAKSADDLRRCAP